VRRIILKHISLEKERKWNEPNGNLQMKYDAPDIARDLNLLNERRQPKAQ
jgi:hypothetical protein